VSLDTLYPLTVAIVGCPKIAFIVKLSHFRQGQRLLSAVVITSCYLGVTNPNNTGRPGHDNIQIALKNFYLPPAKPKGKPKPKSCPRQDWLAQL
jgi:hypothetical protein